MSQTTVPTTNEKLLAWVEEIAALTKPKDVHWCDGSAEEYDSLAQQLVDAGTFHRLADAKRPNSYLVRSDPGDVARVEDRTFICSRGPARRGPDEQLDRPRRDAREAQRPLRRLHGGPHDVRRAVLDGPARLADRAHRRRADRLRLRRREHADHDPHGQGRARRARRRRRVRPVRALRRHAADGGRRGRRRGRATPRTSTSSTSPRRARSGRSARATAATRCSARSASRCGSRRSWRATRAGWPSTC